ncbi:hypothetical protein ElyMa_002528700 [Elysia marginata]|uniref:Uncharacterized protein n=1 Tax=Elysia marginata TaxID=1093978 RepID=A0AAV4GSU3_9GAST|nr:hypothetical protein ElyMa_002528700 [Elysia marginata]
MWTVSVDSNVPITTGTIHRSVSPTPSDPGSRPRSRSFTPDKYLQAPTDEHTDPNDVEALLSSKVPGRPRAASFRGRPPPSAVRKVAAALRARSRSGSRSQSPSSDARHREPSPERCHRGEHVEGWREEQWKFALENAVDDLLFKNQQHYNINEH